MLGVPFLLHTCSLGIKEKYVVAHGWASKSVRRTINQHRGDVHIGDLLEESV